MTHRSYARHGYWERYAPFFPPELDPRSAPPEEHWVRCLGLDIHLDRYRASKPVGTVVLLHGAAGNGRLLAPLGLALRRLNWSVVAPDLPGFGLSEVPRDLDWALWLETAAEVVSREQDGGRPVVVFGLSIGGTLAWQVAARRSADGQGPAGVIATTLLDPREAAVRAAMVRWPGVLGALPLLRRFAGLAPASRLKIPIRRVAPVRAITGDPALARVVAHDPLGGGRRVSLGFLLSLLDMGFAVEPEQFGGCPVLLAHPDQDEWTPTQVSRPLFERLGCEKQLVLLEGCGHIPVEEPGLSQLLDSVRYFLDKITLPRLAPACAEPPEARDEVAG